MPIKLRILLPVLLLFGVFTARAQDTLHRDTLDYYDMSLEQLQNLKAHGVPSELEKLIDQLISVASKKPLSTRESPSIISLITEEEIKNSGARDLIDVLRLVPGMDFGVDVEGVVGLGMRGNWVHEGKVLLLLDGQEMNEIMFATTQFGNHFPVEQIKKIEIIRGPGSAIYGGFAEYGVINIITKSGSDLNGISVSGTYGQMQGDYARRNINLMAGQKINDFEYSLSGFVGQGNRSDQTYTDFYGNSYNMAGNSALNPMMMNIGMGYKGLSFRGIADLYNISVRDAYDVIKPSPYRQDFDSYFGELKYVKKFSDRFTLTPRLNYKK
ncbi:MAG TPA: TonB-dependent receptor plug domain-containing protein, partial [Bacteroidia bacterium]